MAASSRCRKSKYLELRSAPWPCHPGIPPPVEQLTRPHCSGQWTSSAGSRRGDCCREAALSAGTRGNAPRSLQAKSIEGWSDIQHLRIAPHGHEGSGRLSALWCSECRTGCPLDLAGKGLPAPFCDLRSQPDIETPHHRVPILPTSFYIWGLWALGSPNRNRQC